MTSTGLATKSETSDHSGTPVQHVLQHVQHLYNMFYNMYNTCTICFITCTTPVKHVLQHVQHLYNMYNTCTTCFKSGFNEKPLDYTLGFIIESLKGLNFHWF